jgi:hypothetical protein
MATLTAEGSERLLESIKVAAPSGLLWWHLRRVWSVVKSWRYVGRTPISIAEFFAWFRVWSRPKTELRFKDTKTSRNRAITLPAFAVDELRRLKREQAEELIALGIRQTGDTFCCRADGEPLQPRSATHRFILRRERLKDLSRVRLHPTACTQSSRRTPWHSTIITTLDLCSRVTDTMQANAAARLGAAFYQRLGEVAEWLKAPHSKFVHRRPRLSRYSP